jgi:hypothetical protein
MHLICYLQRVQCMTYDWGGSWTGCRGKYEGLNRRIWQKTRGNYNEELHDYLLCKILLEWSNERGWDGRGKLQHVWERGDRWGNLTGGSLDWRPMPKVLGHYFMWQLAFTLHSDFWLDGRQHTARRYSSLPWVRIHAFLMSLLQFILAFHPLYLKKAREWVPSSRRHAPHLQTRFSLQIKVLLGFISSLSRREVINCSCQMK